VDPTTSLASVSVLDCAAFLLGEVTFVNERVTLIGALGEWYVIANATSSWALPARRAADAGAEWAAEARRAADKARDGAEARARDALRDVNERAAALGAWLARAVGRGSACGSSGGGGGDE
jgi:hypothetical protein